MTFKKKNYPPYWKQFSEYIRQERAKNSCEKCGARNGDSKYTFSFGTYFVSPNEPTPDSIELLLSVYKYRQSTVVLTVAHLDQPGDICGCRRFFGFKCARPDHVLALCQACHLAYDRYLHVAVRRKNKLRRKDGERGLLSRIV